MGVFLLLSSRLRWNFARKPFRVVAGTLVGISLAIGVSGCDALGFKEWTWHQRLLLEVATARGMVSGGSVIAVTVSTTPKWLSGGMGAETEGEASFVEVAPGQYLFALLGRDAERAFITFFPEPAPSTFKRAEQLEMMHAVRDVPRGIYPRLVLFDDITDPKTVREVNPDDLAASFGPGVSLRRITLETTNEDVTEGNISSVLRWLPTVSKGMLDGRSISISGAENRLANDLTRLDFERN